MLCLLRLINKTTQTANQLHKKIKKLKMLESVYVSSKLICRIFKN